MVPFLEASITKCNSVTKNEILQSFANINNLTKATGDFMVYFYLPFYLKAAKHVKLIDRKCKPTTIECQNDFIMLVRVS